MKKINVSLYILLSVVFFILVHSYTFTCDDWIYMSMFDMNSLECDSDPTRPILSIWDAIVSQFNHYFMWNGRVIVHFFVQCFCALRSKWFFDVTATFLFLGFSYLLGKFCFPKKNSVSYTFISTFLFFVLFENSKYLFAGIAFVFNYLWSAFVCLTFLSLLLSEQNNRIVKSILPILGVLAGWSHEGFSIPLCAGLFFYWVFNLKKLQLYKQFSIAICALSAMLLIFCPANFVRAAGMSNGSFDASIEEMRIGLFIHGRIIYLLVISLSVLFFKNRARLKQFVSNNIYFFIALMADLVFVSILGIANCRAIMGIEIISLILLCRILSIQNESLVNYLGIVSSSLLLFFFIIIAKSQSSMSKEIMRFAHVLETAKSGEVLYVNTPQVSSFVLLYLVPTTDRWNLNTMQRHYMNNNPIYNGLPSFENDSKVPGKNPFYRKGDYIYCENELPKNIDTNLIIGDYRLNNPVNLLKQIISIILSKKESVITATYDVERLSINGEEYYRIYMPETNRRHIVMVELLN